jgi:hypothetical protein
VGSGKRGGGRDGRMGGAIKLKVGCVHIMHWRRWGNGHFAYTELLDSADGGLDNLSR